MNPSTGLDAQLARDVALVDTPPAEVVQRGAGWGVLERLRRAAAGEPPFCSIRLVFDDATLMAAQTPWLALLRDGALSAADPAVAPRDFPVQPA